MKPTKNMERIRSNNSQLEGDSQEGNLQISKADDGQFFENQRDVWLTTEEAAEYLRVSVGSLRNMVSYGQIPYYKLMGRNRYKLQDLKNLLIQSKLGGPHGN